MNSQEIMKAKIKSLCLWLLSISVTLSFLDIILTTSLYEVKGNFFLVASELYVYSIILLLVVFILLFTYNVVRFMEWRDRGYE